MTDGVGQALTFSGLLLVVLAIIASEVHRVGVRLWAGGVFLFGGLELLIGCAARSRAIGFVAGAGLVLVGVFYLRDQLRALFGRSDEPPQ